jgi:hypothetical protein
MDFGRQNEKTILERQDEKDRKNLSKSGNDWSANFDVLRMKRRMPECVQSDMSEQFAYVHLKFVPKVVTLEVSILLR